MLYWQGNNMDKKYRNHVIIENIEEYPMMLASLQVIIIESKAVDNLFEGSASDYYKPGT